MAITKHVLVNNSEYVETLISRYSQSQYIIIQIPKLI